MRLAIAPMARRNHLYAEKLRAFMRLGCLMDQKSRHNAGFAGLLAGRQCQLPSRPPMPKTRRKEMSRQTSLPRPLVSPSGLPWSASAALRLTPPGE